MSRKSSHIAVAALAAAIALSSAALAQSTVPVTLQAEWAPPTTDASGAALNATDPVTSYEVWISTTPLAASSVSLTSTPTLTVTTTSATDALSAAPGSAIYVEVEACNVNGCSLPTNPVSMIVPTKAVPGLPVKVTIAIKLAS